MNNTESGQQGCIWLLSIRGLPYISTGIGFLSITFYAIQTPDKTLAIFASLVMIAIATASIGAFLGFLFGIPRTNQAPFGNNVEKQYAANTNLEDISDWLTKILVGVSLTQLTSIPNYLANLGEFLKPSLGGNADGAVFGVVTVIYFTGTSFLISYLQTRLRMEEALQLSDKRIKELLIKGNVSDAELQNLVHELLNSEQSEIRKDQSEIDAIFANASPTARQIAFSQAWDMRSEYWSTDKPQMERTIPIFRALVNTDTPPLDHRYFGNLGWALKDKNHPSSADLTEAKDLITKAINARGSINNGYPQYELSRAIVSIQLDENAQQQKASSQSVKDEILGDLKSVIDYNKSWKSEIDKIDTVQNWLKLNNVTL